MNTSRAYKTRRHQKRFLIFLIILLILNTTAAVILFALSPFNSNLPNLSDSIDSADSPDSSDSLESDDSSPKYIFLFIGDGMSHAQITLASQYKTTVERKERGNDNLAMLDFDMTGMAFIDNASTIIGESAASATAMASGVKTYSSYLNYDIDGNRTETIAEKLKKQLNYKIGVISSVNLNHATPAAFYAHQYSRYSSNGDIFLNLLDSGFDFFGGGTIFGIGDAETATGKSFWELLGEKGYRFIPRDNISGFEGLKAGDEKIIAVAPKLDIYGTLPYAIDYIANKAPDILTLADFTKKCIELLHNDTGFFIMVEGGKIDWCGHANDAATLIHEVVAFDEAIGEAVKFYEENPDDTLIIVVGDHETGGLSLGYSETTTSTYLQYLQKQKISYSEFSRIVAQYRENQIAFDDILPDIERYFGITSGYDGTSNFYFSEEDTQQLRVAYEQSLIDPSIRYFTMKEYASYGMYDPLTTVITAITSKKAGITWGSFSHTFVTVPVFAMGNGADLFSGAYHNSEIFHKLKNLLNLK